MAIIELSIETECYSMTVRSVYAVLILFPHKYCVFRRGKCVFSEKCAEKCETLLFRAAIQIQAEQQQDHAWF